MIYYPEVVRLENPADGFVSNEVVQQSISALNTIFSHQLVLFWLNIN